MIAHGFIRVLLHALKVTDFGRNGVSIVWTKYLDNKAWSKTADVREVVLVGSKCDNPINFTQMLL